MLRLASDADVHGGIFKGLRRHHPAIDIKRVQDCLPEGTSDPDVLAWAASENRILISNDRNTLIAFAVNRVQKKLEMPGVIITRSRQPVALIVSDIALIAQCVGEDEIRNQIRYVPL
jgi:hypothetical protein